MAEGLIAVWFSCGAASAVAAKLTVERYGGSADVRIVNNPVAEEDPDNLRFAADVSAWIGREIEHARNYKFPAASAVEVWQRERFMASPFGAPCTRALKKEARQQWELKHRPDWHVLGYAADERNRHERFVQTERSNVLPVLIEAGLSKADCFGVLARAGIEVPAIYKRGYPNANCVGCVKATSPTYWNHVREQDPAVFEQRAAQSRELGARLVRVRGRRVFLDELKPTDKGRPMASARFDCGIFCEEPNEGRQGVRAAAKEGNGA